MSEYTEYSSAVAAIKTAILQSQYDAAKAANETQLMLYFGIGKYISHNSRKGFWGKGAINAISERLNKELPGLRGFSARNLRNMRTFYEEWALLDTTSDNLALANAKTDVDDNFADASAKWKYMIRLQFGRRVCQIQILFLMMSSSLALSILTGIIADIISGKVRKQTKK